MSSPVAIVTGAASGIGLALTKHLLGKGWRVAMADVDEAKGKALQQELGGNASFHRVDVSNFDDLAALFRTASDMGGGRLDFLAANAGIADVQSLYEAATDLSSDPAPLNLQTLRVDLDSVFQAIWLFKHYARQNSVPGGKVVITSSSAGLYPMDTNPQYTAAKHALVGLTRACGPVFLKENITVNCICPAFVPTALAPKAIMDIFPKEHITPMTTVLRAYDTFLADDTMTGQTVELSLDQLYFRESPPYPNESQRWLGEDSKTLWEKAYPAQ